MFYNEEEIFRELFDKAIQTGEISNLEYIGRLLLPGEDASIMVKKSSMTVAIGDVPARKNHPIHAFVTDHEEEIHEITAEDLRSHQEIIIAGRWHPNGDEGESFEPYLTRRITDAGSAKTSKYDYDFFGFGGYGNSIELCSDVSGECAFAFMVAVTADCTDYSHLSPGLAESLALPTGMVWYPAIPSELPFLVVEHAMKIMEQRLACC